MVTHPPHRTTDLRETTVRQPDLADPLPLLAAEETPQDLSLGEGAQNGEVAWVVEEVVAATQKIDVYAVPDPVVGDQVMAAVQLRPGVDSLDPEELLGFLAAQGDLGTKWAPRFVRMSDELPATATNKVLKRSLRAERWNCGDPVLWQAEKGGAYEPLSTDTAATLEAAVGDRPL